MRGFWTSSRASTYACILFLGAIALDGVRRNWPTAVELPDYKIVSFGDGDHGDVIFTEPTFVLLSGQDVAFGNLVFLNQVGDWKGAIIVTGIVTNLTAKGIYVIGGNGCGLYCANRNQKHILVNAETFYVRNTP